MRVGVISHLKFPISRPFAGGLEMFTFALVEKLKDRGHDVVLFASGDSEAKLPVQPIVERATVPESCHRFGRCQDDWINETEEDAYRSLMLELADSDFDVIHNNSLNPIPLQFADIVPARFVTTLHVPVLPKLRKVIRECGPSACGEFVNISRRNASGWRELLPKQRIIPNGVDTDFWNTCRDKKVRRAIWFGRITAEKGTHFAIEAAHAANLPIDIVGPQYDADYFQSEVLTRLDRRDAYLGHRSHEELCDLISRSAVAFVTPCWDEPFGLVVPEAFACGTPVAAFARGALPELVTFETGRLATPGNVHGLADAALQCLELDGEDCRQLARQRYSLDRMVDEYLEIYRGVRSEVAA